MSRQKERYYPDKTYKVTVVELNGNRTAKYFKGDEMEEVEMKIRNKISKIKYWFVETII